jgi:hypothetical protein
MHPFPGSCAIDVSPTHSKLDTRPTLKERGGAILSDFSSRRSIRKRQQTEQRKQSEPERNSVQGSRTRALMVRDPIRMHPRCPSRSCPTIHFVCPVRRRLLLLLLLCVCPFKLVSSQQPPRQQQEQHDFHFQYLERPELRWTQQLAGMSVGRFNVIEPSPMDPNILYLTTQGATLVVLSAMDGSILAEWTPPSNGSTMTTNSMSCHSGMAFGIMPDGSLFLVYTVMDNDNRNDDDETNNFNHTSRNGSDETTGVTSRVVAISLPEHKTLWSSESLPGDSMGSPVVLYESTQRIPYVAFTHNTQLLATTTLADDNSTTTVSGAFTLLNASNGQILWTESASSREEFPQGYGPLGVAVNPIAGNYVGGEDNDNDVVVWGAFDPTGTRQNLGSTYVFQLPPNFQGTQTDIQGLSTSILKSVRWTTMTRPVFGDQGRSMYLGVTGDQLRGWTGKNHFDEAADWQADLSVESTDLSSSRTFPVCGWNPWLPAYISIVRARLMFSLFTLL